MSISSEIEKWIKAVDIVNNEEEQRSPVLEAKKDENPNEFIDKNIEKTDSKIMQMKLDKLNMLVKKQYYAKNQDTAEDRMFQFHFEDKGDHYEFTIPLSILFGKKTQQFAAKYWEDFFNQADIQTSFEDNIREALRQAGGISLKMRLNKALSKEVQSPGG